MNIIIETDTEFIVCTSVDES